MTDDTAAGQPAEPTDPFGFADDFGVIRDPTELTEAEDDYRRRAFEAVAHYAGDFGIPCFPVWWVDKDGTCACKEAINCQSRASTRLTSAGPRWRRLTRSRPPAGGDRWRVGEQIVDWRPKANIGLAMGEKHFLLDVDMGEGPAG